MSNNEITCPHCQKRFALQDSVASLVDERVKAGLEAKTKQREEELRKSIQAEEAIKNTDLQNQLLEQKEVADKARQEQLEANKKLRMVEEKEKSLDIEIEKRAMTKIQEEASKIEEEVKNKYKMASTILKENIEKEYDSKMDEQNEKILLLTKEKEDTQKKLEEAKRASSQISQQAQGEILELDFEKRLKESFPSDKIDEVPKGIEGADYIQRVFNNGKEAGVIIWETKNTKNFDKQWIEKLKNDQRKLSAEVAVIATSTLPKDSPPINQLDGIYVVSLAMALPLAMVLRRAVIRVSETAIANQGREEKAVVMYQYLTSTPFKQKIESIISAYQRLLGDTDKEERAMKKIWAERRKSLQTIVDSTVDMYGELQSIAGKEIPTIKELELDDMLAIEEE